MGLLNIFKIKVLPKKLKRFRRNVSYKYPKAERQETVVDNYFGTKIPDPYRWLEDPDSPKTKAFVEAQNSITNTYLWKCPYRDKFKNVLTSLWDYPKYSNPLRRGDRYFQFVNTGLQNQSVLYVSDDFQTKGDIFLDPNEFSSDGTVALAETSFSEDGKICAYSTSKSGSDWREIKFKSVDSGETYSEILQKVKYSSMAWTHDNKGLFYGAYLDQEGKTDGSEVKAAQRQKLYYHKIGTNQKADAMVVEFDDPCFRLACMVSYCGKYLLVMPRNGSKTNMVYFTEVGEINGPLRLQPIINEFIADFYYVTNNSNKFIFQTNKNAPNGRIVIIDIHEPGEINWKDLIKEHPRSVLEWAKVVDNNKLILCYLQDVKHSLQVNNLETGERIHDFKLEIGSIASCSCRRDQKEMFYSFYSFLTPNIIHRVEFNKDSITDTVIHATKLGEDSSLDNYKTQQVFYKSKDGTSIPMFIVQNKSSSELVTKPCLLYGYGGFNISITPTFSVSRLVFVKHFDGIVAIANVRGGGEYGEKWHDGGRYHNKQNSFDDFQYAARYLISEKYTSPEKLVIQGASNGGLLVAACINQAPELFGVAICQVGVLDMLRFHKFTIGYAWTSDYGHSGDPEQFKYLYRYSPLHNIRSLLEQDVQYPATLLLTADHDDRVVPLHSLKFIAELQEKVGRDTKQIKPLMIRVDTKAGHGFGKPTNKKIEEIADIFCFISNVLDIKFKE